MVYLAAWYLGRRYFALSLDWEWAVATAALSASIDIAWAYRKASTAIRLDPPSAIGFAALCLALILGSLCYPAAQPDWGRLHSPLGTVLMALVATPSVYLVAAATRELFRQRVAD